MCKQMDSNPDRDTVVRALSDHQILGSGPMNGERAVAKENCKKNPGHKTFIPVDKLIKQHLPEQFRGDEEIFEFIKATADLTVRLRVNVAADGGARLGTGFVEFVEPRDKPCQCCKCAAKPEETRKSWKFYIRTAQHVVFDDEESREIWVDFFYDDRKSFREGKVKTVKGGEAVFATNTPDECCLQFMTCDEELGSKLEELTTTQQRLGTKLNDRYRSDASKECVWVVSHPHGIAKRITFGGTKGRRRRLGDSYPYSYCVDTCPGSSGASVWRIGSNKQVDFQNRLTNLYREIQNECKDLPLTLEVDETSEVWHDIEKNAGHGNFIFIGEFGLEHLPLEWQREDIVEWIEARGSLTQRLIETKGCLDQLDDENYFPSDGSNRIGSDPTKVTEPQTETFQCHRWKCRLKREEIWRTTLSKTANYAVYDSAGSKGAPKEFCYDRNNSKTYGKFRINSDGKITNITQDLDFSKLILNNHYEKLTQITDNQLELKYGFKKSLRKGYEYDSFDPENEITGPHLHSILKYVMMEEDGDNGEVCGRSSHSIHMFLGSGRAQVFRSKRLELIVRLGQLLLSGRRQGRFRGLICRMRRNRQNGAWIEKEKKEKTNRTKTLENRSSHFDCVSKHFDGECELQDHEFNSQRKSCVSVNDMEGNESSSTNKTVQMPSKMNVQVSSEMGDLSHDTKEVIKKIQDQLLLVDAKCSELIKSKDCEQKADGITPFKSNSPSTNLMDSLVQHGFKIRPQAWTVAIVGGPTTMLSGIPWPWLNEEKWRLHTFARYPHNAAKSAILLAEDGFAYNGLGVDSDDSVICYFCTGSKRGWQEDESIRETHRDLNPTCPMVSGASCNNVPMAASTTISFASIGNTLSASGVSHELNTESIDADCEDATSPEEEMPEQGAQAPPSKGNKRPAQQRNRFQMASVTVMTPKATSQPNTGTARFQAPTNTFNPLQPTDEGPSSTVTSNNIGTIDNTGQPTEARSRPGNNNIPQSLIQINQNTRASQQTANQLTVPRPANQPASVGQTNQSASSTTINQPNNQPNTSQTAPVNQSNNQTNNQGTAPGNQETNPPANPQNPTYYQLGIITERPKRHEYAVRLKRLDTFGDWPVGHHLKKEDLADAGFYYAGYGDCARCFFCGGGLRNWELGDDVWVEHARWFPKCAYIRQRVGQVFIDTVAYFAQDHETITFDMVVKKMDIDPATFQIDSKETSMKNDPAVVTVRELGFKEEDIVKAVNLHKESSQILSADELFETLETTGAKRGAVRNPVYSSIGPSTDMPRDQEMLDTLKKTNSDLRLQYQCKVCMDKEVAIVFLPCGHLVCCTECSSAMRDCPVCRKQVKGVVRGFMA